LSGFHWRFDNDVAPVNGHCRSLDFWCKVSAVEHRHRLDVFGSGSRWGIFGSTAQCFAGWIQPIRCFIRAAAGIVTLRRNLLSCTDACSWSCFVHTFIPCCRPSRPRRDGSCRITGAPTFGPRRPLTTVTRESVCSRLAALRRLLNSSWLPPEQSWLRWWPT